MHPHRTSWKVLGCVLSAGALLPLVAASGAGDEPARQSGTVWGLVAEKQDSWIAVKADGEDRPVKYVLGEQVNPRLRNDLKAIFVVARVQVTYRMNQAERELVGIKKAKGRATGTVTGVVVENHGWWLEVKPRTGPTDGYAVNFPFGQDDAEVRAAKEALMARVKALAKGDVVTIRYFTDFERHRIDGLQLRGKKGGAEDIPAGPRPAAAKGRVRENKPKTAKE